MGENKLGTLATAESWELDRIVLAGGPLEVILCG